MLAFFGDSPSLITAPGDGSKFVRYEPAIEAEALYEVFAWWVASGNRAQDAPYVIKHTGGVDTVRADQTANGSSWQFLGRYVLDASSQVTISDAATEGNFVVADAVRFSNFESDFSIDNLKAVNDSLDIKADSTALVNVLANDEKLTLSDIHINIITAPAKGVASVNADQSISYTADSTASGADEVVYALCYGDQGLFCDQASIIIDIEGKNDPITSVNTTEVASFKIYPNPTAGKLMVDHGILSGAIAIRLLSLSGKALMYKELNATTSTIELDVSDMPKGLFLLELSNSKHRFIKKVAIK